MSNYYRNRMYRKNNNIDDDEKIQRGDKSAKIEGLKKREERENQWIFFCGEKQYGMREKKRLMIDYRGCEWWLLEKIKKLFYIVFFFFFFC